MIITDYSVIAQCYDKNKIRLDIPKDAVLEKVINFNSGKKINVLDLGCGTGNYIQKQKGYFEKAFINWHAVDKTYEMIEIAKTKAGEINYTICEAENIKFSDNFFDYVVCNFAFHHFENKYKVLDNIYKILKPGGIFKMYNILPEMMKKWWVYEFFPESYSQDFRRFWQKELIIHEFEKRKYKINLEINYKQTHLSMLEIYEDVKRKDISEFSIISADNYNKGRQDLEFEIMEKKVSEIKSELALITVEASKSF